MTRQPEPKEPQIDAEEWQAQCDKHGEYQARGVLINGKRMGGGCPTCEQEKAEVQALREAERQRAARSARVEKLLGGSGIPPRFQKRSFDNYRASHEIKGQARALKLARTYANRFDEMLELGTSIVMVGKPGTGKTHLAAAIAQQVIRAGRSAHFTTIGRLIRSVKSTYSHGAPHSEEQMIQSYVEPDLLIVDEVGVQRGTETERMIITEVFGQRYEAVRPTIVIGNCEADDLGEQLGDRVISRLTEGGGPFIVFDWTDYRPAVHADETLPRREVQPVDWPSEP